MPGEGVRLSAICIWQTTCDESDDSEGNNGSHDNIEGPNHVDMCHTP